MVTLKGCVGRHSKSKDLENILIPGNWCVVKEVHVNGHTRHYTHQIFRVGKKGLIKDEKRLAIDVQSYKNPHMGINERLIAQANGYEIIQKKDVVSLKRSGVKTSYWYNEGTFSPAGGSYIPHDSGEYIGDINVSQASIKKEFGKYIEELELRLNSIPFVLPYQYLHVGINHNHRVPDFFDNAANSMLEYLIKIGHTDKIPSREDLKKAEEIFQSHKNKDLKDPARRKYLKKADEIREKRELLWKEHNSIREELSKLLEISSQRNITLSAISSAIINHSDFGQNEEYSFFVETNKPMVKDDKGEYHSIPTRIFRIYPSKLMTNVMYAVPKDESSRDYVLSILDNFNEKYPDTMHIEEAKQNTKLPAHYFVKKEKDIIRDSKSYVNLCLKKMKKKDNMLFDFPDLFHYLKDTFQKYPHLKAVNYPKIEEFYNKTFAQKETNTNSQ